jgi:lipopolysaccharide export system permease protein
MKILHRYLLTQFLPVCAVALLFFVILLELGDLFANMWKYLSNDVPVSQMLRIFWYYFPKCVSFSMPLAVLFASSYTMGTLYSRNELTSIFASGYPLARFVAPLLVFGLVLSFFMFQFEDKVVIHYLSAKNSLNRILLKQEESLSNTNIVILSNAGKIVYTADYYQDADKKLYTLLIVVRNNDGGIDFILQSPSAAWNGSEWIPDDPVLYVCQPDGSVATSKKFESGLLTEPPETFKKNIISVDELTAAEAKRFIESTRKAGLPFAEQLSNYYKRFSFPLTIFIVLFFSLSLGGRYRKNILLMSLLVSLSVAVLFYVTQMVSMLIAKWEYISPLAGAWFPVLLFIFGGLAVLRHART